MEPAPTDAAASGRTRASCEGGRVAFFGGSFDPPHRGHLEVARAARRALRLDRVLFAPVGAQPLKPKGSTASFAERVAMTELAIAGERGFEVSLADAPAAAGQPNYTLETLRTLRAGLPAGGCLFCLVGADSFANLGRWRGAAQIPFAASLVVASRPGQELGDLARFLPEGLTVEPAGEAGFKAAASQANPLSDVELRTYVLRNPAGETAPFYLLPGLDIEISASEIRAQVQSLSRDSAARSLPAPVADYIRTHSVYR